MKETPGVKIDEAQRKVVMTELARLKAQGWDIPSNLGFYELQNWVIQTAIQAGLPQAERNAA